ncbi:uncharacterized protein L969DRAFT_92522 [Mixia osmundae IAM 14324]|uniref:ELMO domain-containing protein n=1 Tax=Mixia osmundae (strain CBS 9802 / IAM 14324 / JCM 22182 / KY 12970) TaxID=764103 RepID=G7DXA4_MIXOS|nr:uncharacterized protein L969DRAFT_92522 [Mixia osmundae IAM 14324]KEI41292.1 hypothetical protein L969DRAFT_92522 [Mixia osmundae IAM 14324]GAA95214.1 hypothetical protein E5Q_01870 [Mixia osmundae IAM 14324]
MVLCAVCSAQEARYTAPGSRKPYCSVACFKELSQPAQPSSTTASAETPSKDLLNSLEPIKTTTEQDAAQVIDNEKLPAEPEPAEEAAHAVLDDANEGRDAMTPVTKPNSEKRARAEADDGPGEKRVMRSLASLHYPPEPDPQIFEDPLQRDDPKPLRRSELLAIATSPEIRRLFAIADSARAEGRPMTPLEIRLRPLPGLLTKLNAVPDFRPLLPRTNQMRELLRLPQAEQPLGLNGTRSLPRERGHRGRGGHHAHDRGHRGRDSEYGRRQNGYEGRPKYDRFTAEERSAFEVFRETLDKVLKAHREPRSSLVRTLSRLSSCRTMWKPADPSASLYELLVSDEMPRSMRARRLRHRPISRFSCQTVLHVDPSKQSSEVHAASVTASPHEQSASQLGIYSGLSLATEIPSGRLSAVELPHSRASPLVLPTSHLAVGLPDVDSFDLRPPKSVFVEHYTTPSVMTTRSEANSAGSQSQDVRQLDSSPDQAGLAAFPLPPGLSGTTFNAVAGMGSGLNGLESSQVPAENGLPKAIPSTMSKALEQDRNGHRNDAVMSPAGAIAAAFASRTNNEPTTPASPSKVNARNGTSQHTTSGSTGSTAPDSAASPSLSGSNKPVKQPATIITYQSRSVKARIDRNVPVEEIIRQLCASTQLMVKEPSSLFAVRTTTSNELITDDNLISVLESAQTWKLVASPTVEAAEMVDKLASSDEKLVKGATFALRNLVHEKPFTIQFAERGGILELLAVIQSSSGNSLSYALAALLSLLNIDFAWNDLDSAFVHRLLDILLGQSLVNICRPATSILTLLLKSSSSPLPASTSILNEPGQQPIMRLVWDAVRREDRLGQVLISRLTNGDATLTGVTMELINAMLAMALQTNDEVMIDRFDALDYGQACARILDVESSEEITQAALSYQNMLIARYHAEQSVPVSLEIEAHRDMLQQIIDNTGVIRSEETWRYLGLESDDVVNSFGAVGAYGLRLLYRFCSSHNFDLRAMLAEQDSKPADRHCPLALASNDVALSIANLCGFTSLPVAGQPVTDYRPLTLVVARTHELALRFFHRMWNESKASLEDFTRISGLVQSQLRSAMSAKQSELDILFVKSDFRSVREKQMRELGTEDDLMQKAPIRSLRARLYKESFDFIRSQRMNCMKRGAWFSIPLALTTPNKKIAQKSWRFCRLTANARYLCYTDAIEPHDIRPGMDDLLSRVDLNEMTDVTPLAPSPTLTRNRTKSNPGLDTASSALGLSLASSSGKLLELVARSNHQYAEWLDGLSLLRPNGPIKTKETSDLIDHLTDVNLKVKLLDLTGDKITIPSQLTVPAPPLNCNYHYADLGK